MEDGEENQKLPVSGSGEKPEEGKLCIIKIKAPKGDQIETNTSERMIDQPPRVFCSVCDKGFASGKAVAGHMRVHFQSNSDNNHQNAAAKKNNKTDHQILLDCWAKRENNSATAAAGGPTTCSICGKNFPSMKSLFGHMRCHPDREWRGINPPPSSSSSVVAEKEKNSCSSSDDRSDSGSDSSTKIPAVDLAEFLPKWSATDRRGRKARTATSAVVLSPAEERGLRTAVAELIRLAHGDSSESGLTHRVVVESFEATNSNSHEAEIEDKNRVLESRKRRIDDYSSSKKLKFDEGESSERVKTSTESENLTDCKNFTEDESEELMIKKKKMKKKMKLSDLDCYDLSPPPPIIDHQAQTPLERCRYKYVCSTCNKCFPSHQALGGHRSSHNKVRIIDTTAATDHESSSDQNELQIQFRGNPKTTQLEEPPNAANHRCTICNKTFPTGQALGGHKRCHWTGPAVAPSTSAGEASQTGNKVLGFDLNEPPPAEDEEGGAESGHAAGYGHASSSYNSVAN